MRIAIVNDVPLIAEALRRVIVNKHEHQVVWVAHSGTQAVQLCGSDRPDLILMDLVMPGMDGVETTRLIMQQSPCAILIVTASPEDNTNLVFRALGAGALDVTATPVLAGRQSADSALLTKIRTIGKLIAANNGGNGRSQHQGASAALSKAEVETLVVIGSSTGGPVALTSMLKLWTPADNTAVVIVQHIDQAFTDSFADWLGGQIGMPITIIEEGSRLSPGKIFVAKTNDHLATDRSHRLSYTPDPLNYPYRPSVDVFFHCVARHWSKDAIGVVLTGMGRDGAAGLLAMRQAGKLTIAQDQASSAVYGMPRAAAELNAAEHILPPQKIAELLRKQTSKQPG